MPIKTTTFALENDYAGFEVTVRTNPTYAVKLDLQSGDTDKVVVALCALIIKWNLTDDDGTPLPTPKEGTDLKSSVPDDVFGAIISGYVKAVNEATKLPKAPGGPSVTT